MTKTTTLLRACAAVLVAAAAGAAHAVDFRPDGFVLQAGPGRDTASMAGAGLVWDWDFRSMRRHAEISAQTELLVNEWRYDRPGGGHRTLTQLVLVPTLRMQLDQGRSPWFLEVGVGASWADRVFVTPDKQFSTRWNFYDVLGGGYKFGANRERELGLRLNHVSNAGIRNPNPGQEFLQLRYMQRF
jgi:hypothetical protein